TRVELADQVEEACGRGVEVRRQLGDLIPQLIEVSLASLHVPPPSSWKRLYTPVFEAPGRHDKRRSSRRRIFCDKPAPAKSLGLCEPQGRDSSNAGVDRGPLTRETVKQNR